MASNNGQRVAAFLLAMLFLVSTVAATVYVVWQINQDEVLVNETPEERAAAEALAEQRAQNEPAACGQEVAAVSPRTVPSVTKVEGDVTELKKTDIKVGDGEEVQAGDCVAVLYYGTRATDGVKFDGNYETGQPIELSLSGVIAGWSEGIPGMKVGGIRRLEIPSVQAYGESGSGEQIPPNTDLVFEVEVVATKRGN